MAGKQSKNALAFNILFSDFTIFAAYDEGLAEARSNNLPMRPLRWRSPLEFLAAG